MADVIRIRPRIIDETGREPFEYRYFMEHELEHYDRCRSIKELKENERYRVLEEVEQKEWYRDKFYLYVKLQEYQTGRIILFDLAFLLKTVLLIPQVDVPYRRYTSDAFLNQSMRSKILQAKPYITKMEMIDYFKSLVKDQYIYFTFEKVKGLSYWNRNMSHHEALSNIKEHTIYSAHIATL